MTIFRVVVLKIRARSDFFTIVDPNYIEITRRTNYFTGQFNFSTIFSLDRFQMIYDRRRTWLETWFFAWCCSEKKEEIYYYFFALCLVLYIFLTYCIVIGCSLSWPFISFIKGRFIDFGRTVNLQKVSTLPWTFSTLQLYWPESSAMTWSSTSVEL